MSWPWRRFGQRRSLHTHKGCYTGPDACTLIRDAVQALMTAQSWLQVTHSRRPLCLCVSTVEEYGRLVVCCRLVLLAMSAALPVPWPGGGTRYSMPPWLCTSPWIAAQRSGLCAALSHAGSALPQPCFNHDQSSIIMGAWRVLGCVVLPGTLASLSAVHSAVRPQHMPAFGTLVFWRTSSCLRVCIAVHCTCLRLRPHITMCISGATLMLHSNSLSPRRDGTGC